MPANGHRERAALARDQATEGLVELLVSHVDDAYITAGLPGALTAVRELLRRMDPVTLRAWVYELGLETEPVAEGESGEPRPRALP